MKMLPKDSIGPVAVLAVVLGLLTGCATQKSGKTVYHFFPSPPDEPHLQYLTSFSSQKEFRGSEENSFLSYVTGKKVPNHGYGKPYGAAVAGHKLYVCDTELGVVVVADFAKRHMSILPAEGEGELKMPLNMTVDADGTLYVADAGRDQIVIFDNKENYVAAIGKAGELKPRDVAVGNDRIYVADLQKHCVRVFDKATRAPLFDIPRGQDATNQAIEMQTPTNLALDSRGRLYVADTGHFRVKVFDADGKFLHSVGEFGDGLGQFTRLKGVAVDHDYRLYAVDAMSQVVQIFNDEGRMLTFFGDPFAGKEFQNLPAKVVVDYDDVNFFQSFVAPNFKVEYLVFVINQFGSHKVSVYGFGNKK
jgi:DNA-binding beta-propeller fold protein YncE